MKVRFVFTSEITIEGENMKDVANKFDLMPLFTKRANESGADFCDIVAVEDADTFDDLKNEYFQQH